MSQEEVDGGDECESVKVGIYLNKILVCEKR